MYSALAIAKYIIITERKKGHLINNLKLQKILYFIQAEFLIVKNEPCFKENIIASDFGPIILEVYHEYKIFGSACIPFNIKIETPYIWKEDAELIDGILDELRNYSASYLTNITIHQTPWIESYNKYNPYENKVISHKLIKKFFQD